MTQIYVGFDRDGTLEMPGSPFPTMLSKQFLALRGKRIKLFLASGKNYDLLRGISKDIQLDPWMICAENGGHIVIKDQAVNVICQQHPDLAAFKAIISSVTLPPYNEEPKESIWSKKFGDAVLEAETIIQKLIHAHQWDLKVYSYPDGDGGLDVVPPGIDKTLLLSHIPDDSIIYYVGDGDNDLSLLTHNRVIPCTVSNAKESVKRSVAQKNGYLATRPAGEGVSELLDQLFLSQE